MPLKKKRRYQELESLLKEKIQQGELQIGDYLPSENELCTDFSITRTTVRKALDNLLKEGFIEKQHGKGSRVRERRQSLGLLNVKGFSEVAGGNVKTEFIAQPTLKNWPDCLSFQPSETDRHQLCFHFERLRSVGADPVMLENNWFAASSINDQFDSEFIGASFFKTLSQKYQIEITGSEQELRAEFADERTALLLKIEEHAPVLHISAKFHTDRPNFFIYSELYCSTTKYPIGNSYHL